MMRWWPFGKNRNNESERPQPAEARLESVSAGLTDASQELKDLVALMRKSLGEPDAQ